MLFHTALGIQIVAKAPLPDQGDVDILPFPKESVNVEFHALLIKILRARNTRFAQ
jgi:hypothetical protein